MTAHADAKQVSRDVARQMIDSVELATLPAVTLQIFRIIRDPEATVRQLAGVVQNDPALCARMLKVVNSPLYGLPRQVNSIERAITLLGFNGLKRIVLAAKIYGMFPDTQLTATVHAEHIWHHSAAVATAARRLAEAVRVDPGNAYLAGVIHDVGIVVEIQAAHARLADVIQHVETHRTDFLEVEYDTLGVDHAVLGEALCEKWGFPDELVAAAGYHHDPLAAPDEHRTLCAIVHVADVLAARNGIGYAGTVASHQIDHTVLDLLGLDRRLLDEIESEWVESIDRGERACRRGS